ncbi:MAG: DUF1460 domain-containing protein [Candidatus Obscuribacterales bacterium]|nr:DUF1460 domain-containing protein [Candidatus Obscuribacterales bacterium]
MLARSDAQTKTDRYSRRLVLKSILTTCGALTLNGLRVFSKSPVITKPVFQGEEVFDRIAAKSRLQHWEKLAIGALMGKIAEELLGIPYVPNTLELSTDNEFCSVNFQGLDCVTFFETTLDFARILKKGLHSPSDLINEVTFTRYRNGVVGDYTSRLHYTTDWFADNQKKKVIQILDRLPGAVPFTQKVSVMSDHPNSSIQLKAHPELVSAIKKQETSINNLALSYVPMSKIADIENLLQTGDIVGVCSNAPGIDITHTGLIYCDAHGVRHFMDASSKKSAMKVQIENGPISTTLNWSKSLTGAMFARPLEPT